MSAPLTPLELRLEFFNRLGNASDDFLKRLYDRRSIVERYLALETEVHVHFVARDGMFCAKYSRVPHRKRLRSGLPNLEGTRSAEGREFPVFVFVGKVSQRPRPIASLVRLQPLECCDMASLDALAPSLLFPPLELIGAVHNRKLRELLGRAEVKFGEFENEIFQRSTQVIANLADQDGNAHRGGDVNFRRFAADVLPTLGLEMSDRGLGLFPLKGDDQLPQIGKVFCCPKDPLRSSIERMREHGIIAE